MGRPSPVTLTGRKVLRLVLLGTIPWGPAYLFERLTFFFEVNRDPLYFAMSGWRIIADVVSFALGGILVAYLLRPRLALFQILLNTVLTYALSYNICQTFWSGGVLRSECYLPGPDGLSGYRLGMMMFALGALPIVVKGADETRRSSSPKIRLATSIFSGVIVSVASTFFPMAAWFSGASYIPVLLPIQAAVLFGVPAVASGMLVSRISRSVKVAALSGITSSLYLTASYWTLLCPGCDRSLILLAIPSWGFFALLGGLLELGKKRQSNLRIVRVLSSKIPTVRAIALGAVITVSLMTAVAYQFWEPSVLYASAISPDPSPLYLGLPIYRPYIAGYYNSTQYRICCLEIGVSFVNVDTSRIAPNNFLMAGMGVQSPNCCVDGWDFGWRADVFLLSNGSMLVSGTSWETCDFNANCGGHFWQHMWYHTHVAISPINRSDRIFLRLMWEAGQVNWYYNYTGHPWQRFGTFTPDQRQGTYFDIGVIGPGHGRDPYHDTYFYQFGVGSNSPVPGWTIQLLYPSFQYEGSWRLMESAAIIQGDLSLWKAAYRWGGAPYLGVTARASALDPSFEKYVLELSYTGRNTKTSTPLW